MGEEAYGFQEVFTAGGTGAIHKPDGITRKRHDVETVEQRSQTSARKIKLGCNNVF